MADQPIPTDVAASSDIPVRPIAQSKRRYLGRTGRDYGVISSRDTVFIAQEDFDPAVWEQVEVLADADVPHLPFGKDWSAPAVSISSDEGSLAVFDNADDLPADQDLSASDDFPGEVTSRRTGRNKS